MSSNRRVVPVSESFFCDGHWYVLGSTSLGGSGLSAQEIGDRLQSDDPLVIRDLLTNGVCLPLQFPADCCLDNAVIIVGDLDEQEQQEWVGRLQSKLSIPCGEFMLMAGGLDEDFEVALEHFEAPDPHYVSFQKLKVAPGDYLVEVYAFLGSNTVNEAWEDRDDEESFVDWWRRTRPGELDAEWIAFYEEEEYVDGEEFELLEYIIRLAPLADNIPPPPQDASSCWCSIYEIRHPDKCPVGLKRASY